MERPTSVSSVASQRRQCLLELLDRMNPTIEELTRAIEPEAGKRTEVARLTTHPGVGPITALAFVLIIGAPERFPRGKQIGSYVGLIPAEDSRAGRQRLGRITKQGSTLLRFLLVEAAQAAARCDTDWKRRYVHLAMRRQRNIAKMAMALAQNPRPPQWAAANGDHLWGAAEVELDARLSFLYSALAWRSTGMFESASLQVAKKSS